MEPITPSSSASSTTPPATPPAAPPAEPAPPPAEPPKPAFVADEGAPKWNWMAIGFGLLSATTLLFIIWRQRTAKIKDSKQIEEMKKEIAEMKEKVDQVGKKKPTLSF